MTLIELFGWLLHYVQTSFYVKINLKTSSSTARTKTWLEKDTYSLRKVHFILVPKMLVFFYLQFHSLLSVVCWWFTLMELFGWLLHYVQTSFYVKIHLKTSSSTARIKNGLEKDTYSLRKIHFILVHKMLVFFYLQFHSLLSVVCWWFTLMELFGWLLHCVQTSFYVKIPLKTSSSTARTKSGLEKDTYSLRKIHFILVLEMLVFFLSSIPLNSFSCLLMIHVDGIIWMAFALCPN